MKREPSCNVPSIYDLHEAFDADHFPRAVSKCVRGRTINATDPSLVSHLCYPWLKHPTRKASKQNPKSVR